MDIPDSHQTKKWALIAKTRRSTSMTHLLGLLANVVTFTKLGFILGDKMPTIVTCFL